MKSKEDAALELAIEAAKKAGAYLREREGMHVDSLSGKDIKLSSDKGSERIILDILSQTHLPILSEEFGLKKDQIDSNESRCWIVDPLDGTMNYYKGMDELACVSIALWENNKPILGVINRFSAEELFYGWVGDAAYCNGASIKPSETEEIAQAVLATGFPVKRAYDDESLIPYVKKTQAFKKVRMLGAAAIMGAYVSCGRIDVYEEDGIMLWDVAGAVAIAEAAGCKTLVEMQEEYKVHCQIFANEKLLENYHAKSI